MKYIFALPTNLLTLLVVKRPTHRSSFIVWHKKKKLSRFLKMIILYFSIFLPVFACSSGSVEKKLIGKWSRPALEIIGLNQEEKSEYNFVENNFKNIFGNMQIEYFDDRDNKLDTYQIGISAPAKTKGKNDFGEYEVLANGKRLVLHTTDSQSIDINIASITEQEQQWRLRYSDMIKLSGGDIDLPEDLPNCTIYLTFKKENY